jgi:pimeloyl-ACP methyl ester carboxylesterase
MRGSMQERWRDVPGDKGVRLSVRVVAGPSAAAPGLVLHHGLASSQRIWDGMLPRLARTFRIVTFDARGHGRSAKPGAGYGFEHTVADALAVIRATRLGRPVIVGHSWGANVALEIAVRARGRVAGTVLVDGGVGSLRARMSWAEARDQLAPPPLAGIPFDEFLAGAREMLGSQFPWNENVEALVRSLVRVDRTGSIRPRLSRANHMRILHAMWEQDMRSLYRRLRVPVLAVLARPDPADGAARDFLASKRRGAALAREAASELVRVTWIDGVHDLPLQHPNVLASRIDRFARAAVR